MPVPSSFDYAIIRVVPRVEREEFMNAGVILFCRTERFHWLVSPRSTIIQTSPVHSGICSDPREALQHLLETMVRLPSPL